jgi:hypothetical protein
MIPFEAGRDGRLTGGGGVLVANDARHPNEDSSGVFARCPPL